MSTQVQKAQTLTPLLKNKEGLPDVPSPFIMVCAYFGYLIKLYYARIFSHPMLLNIFYNKLKNGRDAFCLCEYQLCYLDMEQDTRKKWSRNAQQVVSYRTNFVGFVPYSKRFSFKTENHPLSDKKSSSLAARKEEDLVS